MNDGESMVNQYAEPVDTIYGIDVLSGMMGESMVNHHAEPFDTIDVLS